MIQYVLFDHQNFAIQIAGWIEQLGGPDLGRGPSVDDHCHIG